MKADFERCFAWVLGIPFGVRTGRCLGTGPCGAARLPRQHLPRGAHGSWKPTFISTEPVAEEAWAVDRGEGHAARAGQSSTPRITNPYLALVGVFGWRSLDRLRQGTSQQGMAEKRFLDIFFMEF